MKTIIVTLISLFACQILLKAQGQLGTGIEGDLLVNAGQTIYTDNIRSATDGDNKAGNNKIRLKNADAFNVGDEILIITMKDTTRNLNLNKTGNYEYKVIVSKSNNILTLDGSLINDYDTTGRKKNQAIKVPQYVNVTVNGTLTCSAWDGESGGILCFRAKGTVSASSTGIITVTGKGYRGGNPNPYGQFLTGYSGESYLGVPDRAINYKSINGGGGASGDPRNTSGNTADGTGGGGAGSYGTAGTPGVDAWSGAAGGFAGIIYGDAPLSKIFPGSGGGGTGVDDNTGNYGATGGAGGGIIMIYCNNFNNINTESKGAKGGNATGDGSSQRGGGGGGAGGSILISAVAFTISTTSVTATGGIGGSPVSPGGTGGAGGNGRIRINYSTGVKDGTINPIPYEGGYHILIDHKPLLNIANSTTPYVVNANVNDVIGHVVSDVKLFYRVDGGSFAQVVMTTADNSLFSANIPAQDANKVIDYYIKVTEGSLQVLAPSNAPVKTYSFKISGEIPMKPNLLGDNKGIVTISWNAVASTPNFVDYSVYKSETPDFAPDVSNTLVLHTNDTSFVSTNLQDAHTYYYIVSANYLISGATARSFSPASSILVNNQTLTTIQGFAYLEGRSNHSNIKVKFNPISPSAVLDSTYTNALGYYQKAITPGVYAISYEKTFFATYTTNTISFITDTYMDAANVFSIEGGTYAGSVKGIWNKNYYGLIGDITVNSGDTLVIKSGSKIRSYGNFSINVNGYLRVEGALGDTVLFSRGYSNKTPSWGGIDMNDPANDNSFLHFAIVEYGVDGLYVINTTPEVSDSKFRFNTNTGIQMQNNANMRVTNVEIYANNSYGIYMNYAYPVLNNVYIHHSARGMETHYCGSFTLKNSKLTFNANYGMVNYYCTPSIANTDFSNNTNSGLYYSNAGGTVNNCNFNNNKDFGVYFDNYNTCSIANSSVSGNTNGGVRVRYQDNVRLEFCNIKNNTGHGVLMDYNNATLTAKRNILAKNTGDGILVNGSSNNLYAHFNTIYGNTAHGIEKNVTGTDSLSNNIIVNNGGWGLVASDKIEAATYNDIYGNTSGNISNLTNMPIDSWKWTSVNAKGDKADVYLNISEEPSFTDPANNNFYLTPTSKCIDVGSTVLRDPDGTQADLGALYRDFGNPHLVNVTAYAENTIALSWDKVRLDSLLGYKVYFKYDSIPMYTYFNQTTDTFITVTGLENAKKYNFSVKGVFAAFESGYAPKATGIPGLPKISLNPPAMILNCPSALDTLVQTLTITNPGSRPLNVKLGMDGYATFDGSGDYINAGSQVQYNALSAFTMETFIRRRGNGHVEFMGKHYYQYSFYFDGSNRLGVYKSYSGNTYTSYTSNYTLPANEWHHVAVTWKGNIITFYIDGKFYQEVTNNVTADPVSTSYGSYNFQLGRRADENNYYLNGDLAEARLWNYARTEAEINMAMNTTLNGNEQGLIGYWPLHNDFTDHSRYAVNSSKSGDVKIQKDFSRLGFAMVINPLTETIAPGATKSITFKFPRLAITSKVFTIPIFTDIQTQPQIDYNISITYGQVVPSSPVHFKPVASTGLPYTLVITNALIDGVKIQIGDEIAVYDGPLCVGAGIFDGNFNFSLTAWKADQGQNLPGYTDGNPITYKIYDNSADMEATTTPTYTIGDGKFGYGLFSSLVLNGSVFRIQPVALKQNMFSLISFNMIPRQAQSSTIFSKLTGLKIVYDDQGRALIPEYSINTIGDIDFRKGYHVFSSKTDTINYEGTKLDPGKWDIKVEAKKWNSIAYLGDVQTSVTTAFPVSMHDSISIVQTSDGTAWIPSLSVNTIGNLKPGTGYQIALNGKLSKTFTYQITALKSATFTKVQTENKYFSCQKSGLPYMVVIELDNNLPLLSTNDEIGIFDGENCVGATVYEGSSNVVVPAWEANDQYNLAGFNAGNPISVRIFKVNEGLLYSPGIKPVGESTDVNFKSGNFSHIKMADVETGINNLSDVVINSVYPIPCHDKFTINYTVVNASDISLSVTDINGRKICTQSFLNQASGKYLYEFNMSELSSGVYFLIINAGKNQSTRYKIIKQ